MSVSEFFKKPAVQIAGAVLLPNLGGFVSGSITAKQIKVWFDGIKHPSFRPPNWVFAPTWTALYSGMGYASYLVWKQGNGFSGPAKIPLILYGSQLALNWAWTPLFFGLHDLKLSAIEIVGLTGVAAATGISFYQQDKVAGLLFIPYLAWLSFAAFLNYTYYKLNTPAIEDKKEEEKKN